MEVNQTTRATTYPTTTANMDVVNSTLPATTSTVTSKQTTTTLPLTTTTTTMVPTTSTTTPTVTTETTSYSTTMNNTYGGTKTKADGGMDGGVTAGIIVGIVAVVVIVILGIVLYRRRRRAKQPKVIAKLPSAADVDRTIDKLKDRDKRENQAFDEDETKRHPSVSSQYANLDATGRPSDKTNPNVGPDGYLKKTSHGVNYLSNGQDATDSNKEKQKKKKLKDKFKKKENTKMQELHVTSAPVSEHQYVNRVVSEAEYNEGRPAEIKDTNGYSGVTELRQKPNKTYENINVQGNAGGEIYYNETGDIRGPTSIYENT